MKMRRWAFVVFVGTMLGLGGCAQNKTRMVYSADAWRLVPILSPGETFELKGLTIVWDRKDDPCVPGSSPCTIREGLKGKLYSYTCKETDCDPEIAVDDPGLIVKTAAVRPGGSIGDRAGVPISRARPTHVIQIACVNGATAIADTEVHVGETIGWGAYGSGVQDGWKVNINKQADLCNETAPIQAQMICTVKAQPTSSFTYYVTDACTNQQSTPPSINVIER
jgi:hypothetical protein